MNLPIIAKSDILSRWHKTCSWGWDATSSRCSECLDTFQTGDLNIVFGDLEQAAARKFYLCLLCASKALESGSRPSGIAVFIERRYLQMDFEQLPLEAKEAVLGGFTLADRISDRIEGKDAAASEGS